MKGRKRNRMQGFDYTQDAIYFITICTKERLHHFGKIVEGKMIESTAGSIVAVQIRWLEQQYPYFELHNFVVMPNHLHLLFRIDRGKIENKEIKIKSVSSLIGALKTTTSKQIHLSGNITFMWQRSFHDHIVRTDGRYRRIDQ